jgi:hypothetical protein
VYAAGLLLLFPFAAAADQLWQVNMDITLQGNGSCGGACTQTIDASFLYDGQFDAFGGWVFEVVPGSVSITGSGPLGTSFSTRTGDLGFDNYNTFVPLFGTLPFSVMAGGGNDEIDVFRPAVGTVPVVPSFSGAAIYGCVSTGCFNGFAKDGTDPSAQSAGGSIGYPFWVTQNVTNFTYTVTAVAEPATLSLLAGGLAVLAGLRKRGRTI